MEAPEFARLEIKFVNYREEFAKLEQWLKLHWLGFAQPYPDRKINNIYFDSFDYRAYAENLSGASQRNKVRYRWYGEVELPASGTLEVKRKRNFFGWKLKYPVAEPPYEPGLTWKEIRRRIYRQIPAEGQIWMQDHPQIMMLNRYWRRYYVSNCQRIRVTFDWDQAIWDQRYKSTPNFHLRGVLPDTVVVEVKFARADRDLASEMIQSLPVRVGRHSKYMNGVRSATAQW